MKRANLSPLLAPIALAAPLCLLFFDVIFRGKCLFYYDTMLYLHPIKSLLAQALREWRLPLRTPYFYGGSPMLADCQTGAFYPLNWLVYPIIPMPHAYSYSV